MYHKLSVLTVTVLLCFIANCSLAQKTTQQKLDSLEQLLPNAKNDTNKVKLFYKLAANYAVIDDAKAAVYAGQMESLAHKLNWPKGMSTAYSILASQQYKAGDLSKTQEYFSQVLKVDQTIGNKAVIANDLGNMAAICWQQKNYSGAIDLYTKELKICQETGNKKGAAFTHFNIGEVYRTQNNYQPAIDNYLAAQQIDQELNDQAALAKISTILAAAYSGLNKGDNTGDNYLQAIKQNHAAGNKTGEAQAETNLGFFYFQQKDYARAMSYYQLAKKLYDPRTDKLIIAVNLNNMGVLYNVNHQYATAIDSCFIPALKIYQEVKDDAKIAGVTRNMGIAYKEEGDVARASDYYTQALKAAEVSGQKPLMISILTQLGSLYESQSSYPKALGYFLQALKINEALGNKTSIAANLKNISGLYAAQGNYDQALGYAQRTLKIYQDLNNREGVQLALNDIGVIYGRQGNAQKALDYLTDALKATQASGNKASIAVNLNDIGDIYNQQHNYLKALDNTKKALAIQEEMGAKGSSAYTLSTIGEIYLAVAHDKNYVIPAGDTTIPRDRAALLAKTAGYINSGIAIFKQTGNLDMLQVDLEHLADIEEMQGNYTAALSSYKQHIIYRDSVFNREKDKDITRRQLAYDFGKREDSIKYQQTITDGLLKEKTLLATQQQQTLQLNNQQLALDSKQKELQHLAYLKEQADLQTEQGNRKQKEKQLTIVEKEKALQETHVKLQQSQLSLKDAALQSEHKQKLFYIVGVVLLVILAFFIWYNFINQQKANKEIVAQSKVIEAEKQKSDDLLLNILPAEIAEELKQKGETEAQLFDNVSVLFTDFVNFSGISESLTPKQLVNEIHQCFTAFDAIMERHGLEKIKTIGDAYLAVCGLPNPDPLHAEKTIKAALEVRDFIAHRKEHNNGEFNIRIGINSGPLVAGIVGVKKFAYDIWGDTVNTAARMEQNSTPGKVNISESTYGHVKEQFAFTYRGEIAAKNKGTLKMYFVDAEPV